MRKIIHVDMDCFYAAIEVRDNPALCGLPVAVGGKPGQRGVLCTCNYEARRFGLRSAMSSTHALHLCPDVVILPVDMAKYKAVSQEIHKIFRQFTHLVEPLSLDEAYLDVSACQAFQGSGTLIAEDIRRRIFDAHRLTASAGIAPNKFLAKIASDWRKPNGQYVIPPDQMSEFVRDLPVEKIFGVGKVTANKLHRLHIRTCGELQQLSREVLITHFGKFGTQLYWLSRGIDDRPVIAERTRKSLSAEETFVHDLPHEQVVSGLEVVYRDFTRRFSRLPDAPLIKSIFIKIKFADFTLTTVQAPFTRLHLSAFQALCEKGLQRKPLPVRLLGVGVQFQSHAATETQAPEQLSFWNRSR